MKYFIGILILTVGLHYWWTDPSVTLDAENFELSYQVKYSGGANSGDTLPMLIALHGNGDSPGNFHKTALDKISAPARIIVLKGVIKYGSGSSWPWSEEDFQHYGPLITQAIQEITMKYPTTGKPVMFGFSGGGMFAYHSALYHGSNYSFIFPISGKLVSQFNSKIGTNVGAEVIAYHGKSDSVVSYSGGKSANDFLQARGVKSQLHSFDGGHHGVFSEMKADIATEVDRKLLKLQFASGDF